MSTGGWLLTTVGDVAQVKGGKRLPAGYFVQNEPTSHPYIRVSDMRDGGIDESDIKYVPTAAAQAIRAYRIRADDIFISVAGTLGIVGRVPAHLDGANLTENADRLTDIKCDVDYLAQYLRSAPIQAEIDSIRTVGAQPKLALGRIRTFQLQIPKDRAEQEHVAGALADADNLISSLEQLIAKKCDIKQGMMQGLLTGRTRLPGFTADWTPVTLGNVGATYGGLAAKSGKDFGHGNGRFVTFVEVMREARLRGTDLSPVDIRKGERQNVVRRGDVLLNGSSETPEEVALAAAVEFYARGVYLNSFCFGYRLNRSDEVDPLFLAYLFRAAPGRQLIVSLAQGSTRYNIAKTKLMSSSIELPEFAEQQAIVNVFRDVDDEIHALEDRLESARAIKTGMMQELLTGRTRLPVEEVVA